jgi:hypothetical protein
VAFFANLRAIDIKEPEQIVGRKRDAVIKVQLSVGCFAFFNANRSTLVKGY